MNNKIEKAYQDICKQLKTNDTEENKQQYMNLFKELDIALNKEFLSNMDLLSATAPTLSDEINRVDKIIYLIKSRISIRNTMIEDHTNLIGYKPVNLEELVELDELDDYSEYKKNLLVADSIVSDLIKSSKKITSLKKKNKASNQDEINRIQKDRAEKLESLKNNEPVLNDLYDYCITAPFNEENAYIEYLMIKMSPKVGIGNAPKRMVKKHEKKSNKPLEGMPVVANIGSVKPNNMLKAMEEAVVNFEDINVPTNGLVNRKDKVEIDAKDLKEN